MERLHRSHPSSPWAFRLRLNVYKSLQIVLPDPEAADAWVKKPNAFFGNRSALEVMLDGQVVDIYKVREYLDAQRGG